MARPPASPVCLNCGSSAERFCPRCGQRNVNYRASLGRLLREIASEFLALDSRLLHTLGPFLFQPGALTRDYNEGRRARYVTPLRLYVFASVLCFLVLGVRQMVAPLPIIDVGPAPGEPPRERERDADADADAPGAAVSTVEGLLLPEPWMQNALVREVNRRAQLFGTLPSARQSEILRGGVLTHAPTAIFLLLPLYALLLKLVFLGTGRYYVEHVIFALHLHAFVFLAIAAIAALPESTVTSLIGWSIPAYALLALRRAYAIGWPGTLLRATFVGTGYAVLLIVGTVLVVLSTVILQQ